MASRRPGDDRLVAIGLGIGVILVLLAVTSGVLPWAILGGVVVAGVAYWQTYEWETAGIAGAIAAGAILLIGGMSVLSPGWYQGLF